MKRLGLLTLCLLVLLSSPKLADAQSGLAQLSNNSLSITLDPSHPEPHQKTTVELNNLTSGLYGSTITWYRNGNKIESAQNQTSFELTTGSLGETLTLEARVDSLNDQITTVRHNITPVYLDIVVEPQTHVPDFYLGRPLPTPGSLVNMTAILEGVSIPTSNLTYTWRVNQKVLGGGGQRGQYKTSFTMPLDSQVLVSLDVQDLSGVIVAKKSFFIANARPFVNFYEVNTLYGILPRPIDELLLSGNSVSVRAEPYYLDSRVYNSPDIHTWELNRREVSAGNNPYELTLQKTGSTGSARVNFYVRSLSQTLQGATADLTISY